MLNNNNHQIENQVMKKIKTGQVKLRSKYIFLAEKLGLSSAVILSLILAVLFFTLTLFYMRATDNLAYLSFGQAGLLAFLESFPYALILVLIILTVLVIYLIKKSYKFYKQPSGYIIIALILFIIFTGSALAYTRVAEEIENQVYRGHLLAQPLRPFLNQNIGVYGRGVSGVIFEISDNYLVIQTPQGLHRVDIKKIEDKDLMELKVGSLIMAIGNQTPEGFMTQQIRIIDQTDLPMLRRGIQRRFESHQGEFPPEVWRFSPQAEECLNQCRKTRQEFGKCLRVCLPD